MKLIVVCISFYCFDIKFVIHSFSIIALIQFDITFSFHYIYLSKIYKWKVKVAIETVKRVLAFEDRVSVTKKWRALPFKKKKN